MNEGMRLETLCARDGVEAARQWADWTTTLYRQSIRDPNHFASQLDWKPIFEQSIRELAMFAESGVVP